MTVALAMNAVPDVNIEPAAGRTSVITGDT